MIVVLTKSWTNKFGRKYPVGQRISCDKELSEYLIENRYAKDYDGKYRQDKVKSDFFKPKNEIKWQ
jgi:hypothetical protein